MFLLLLLFLNLRGRCESLSALVCSFECIVCVNVLLLLHSHGCVIFVSFSMLGRLFICSRMENKLKYAPVLGSTEATSIKFNEMVKLQTLKWRYFVSTYSFPTVTLRMIKFKGRICLIFCFIKFN